MSNVVQELTDWYVSALQAPRLTLDDRKLIAYDLGLRAVQAGCGITDVLAIHKQGLHNNLLHLATEGTQLTCAIDCLEQSLLPFESYRKQTEIELVHQRELREALFTESADALFIVNGKTLLIEDCNQRAVELFEAEHREALLGISGHTLQRQPFTPDELTDIVQAIERCGVWSQEVEYVTRKGTLFWGNLISKRIQIGGHLFTLVRITDVSDRRRAEDALRQSEQRLRAILDNSPFPTFLKDAEGRYILANPALETMFHLSQEEILGKTDRDLLPIEIASQCQTTDRIVLQTGQRLVFEETVPMSNEQHTFLLTKFALPDASGHSTAICGITIDITARKQAEQALQERETHLSRLIDNIPGAVYRCAHNREWSGMFISNAIEAIVGYPATDFFETGTRTFASIIYPDDHAAIDQIVDEALATRQPFRLEFRIIHADGSLRWVSERGRGVFDDAGNLLYLDGVIFDISNQKQAETALRDSEQRLQAILDASPFSIFMKDAEGRYILVNPAYEAMMALTREELLGRSDYDILPIEVGDRCWATDQRALQSGQPITFEEMVPIAGEPHTVLLTKFALHDLAEYPTAVCGIAMDITERKRVEDDRKRFVEALHRSEERLMLALDAAKIGTWEWNIETGQLLYSDNIETILGTRPAATYNEFLDLTHSEDYEILVQTVNQALENQDIGDRYFIQHRICLDDGSIRWLESKGKVLRNSTGHPVQMLGTVIDISEAKRREAERLRTAATLQENEQFLRSIYEGIGVSIFAVDIMENGEFRYAGLNPTHERLTGISTTTLQHKLPEQVLPATVARGVIQHYQDCVDAEAMISYEECLPFRGQETWWITSLNPVRDEQARIYRLIGTCMDITDRKLTEQALLQSEERFRQLAENVREVFFVRSVHLGSMLYISPAYETIWGHSCESLYQNPLSWLEAVHPEDRELAQTILRTDRPEKELNREYRIMHPDGTIRWICDRSSIVYDQNGNPYRVVGTAEDVTRRKEAEQALQQLNQELELRIQQRTIALEQSRLALQEREEELRTLLENSPDVIARFDRNLQHIYINEAVTQVTGQPVESFIGHRVADTALPPYYIQQSEAAMQRVFQTGKEEELEVEFPTAEGVRWFKTRLIPERDTTGAVITLLEISEDVTDRKHSEASLRESEEKFRQLTENIGSVFWMRDRQNQLLYVSPSYEQVWGQSVQHLYQHPTAWLEAVHPDEQSQLLELTDVMFQEGYDEIYRILRPDGEIRWIHDRGFPIQDEQGRSYRIVGIAEDISTQQQAEAQIQSSLQEKEILLKEIHHRVKNNLQIISALLSFQADTIQDPKILSALQDSENRLQAMALIHETLYQSEDLGRLNFSSYIQRLADSILMANSTRTSPVQLVYQLEPIFLNLETAIPCGLLLNELITNAIKHAFPDNRQGCIWLTLRQISPGLPATPGSTTQPQPETPPRYSLSIQDDGVGMPQHFNLDNLKSLGLRIARDLTHQLRGTLELDQSNGTHFTIVFSELKYRKRF